MMFHLIAVLGALALGAHVREDGAIVSKQGQVLDKHAGKLFREAVIQTSGGRVNPSSGRRQVKRARSSGRHDWKKRLAARRGR